MSEEAFDRSAPRMEGVGGAPAVKADIQEPNMALALLAAARFLANRETPRPDEWSVHKNRDEREVRLALYSKREEIGLTLTFGMGAAVKMYILEPGDVWGFELELEPGKAFPEPLGKALARFFYK